jgi:hypothetical protein
MQASSLLQRRASAAPFRAARSVSTLPMGVVRRADGAARLTPTCCRPQAPVVAPRAPLVCRAAAQADAAEVVSVSEVANKEAVAHLRFQRGSVFKVRTGSGMWLGGA